ncbi:MAG TPA: MarP family serine protease [Egibacteraceae bacterium]|nr:MarP family serine protease [Egibacteraceae bacterium]
MNLVDIVLLVALLFAALRGFRQGALSQVAAFGGAALGLVVGAVSAPRLAPQIVQEPGATLALVTLGLLLLCIALGQTVGLAIGWRLRHAAASAGHASVDRTAGIAVGLTGVLLAVWLLGSVLVQGPVPALAKQVRQSEIVGVVAEVMPQPPDLFGRVGNYLDRHGFPTVFSGFGGAIAPPVDPPGRGAVAAAQRAGQASTVQVVGTGCGGISSGSGFVTRPGFVVTNAHVIAGSRGLSVRSADGEFDAETIAIDTDIDLAVLRVPDLDAPPIRWVGDASDRGTAGATLGFPGGQRQMEVKPAAVRGRSEAMGRDIYGRGNVRREILTLSAGVQRGDSGGPFVTSDGRVGGVVFAAAAAEPGTGYALTAESVRGDVVAAIERNEVVGTASCRF